MSYEGAIQHFFNLSQAQYYYFMRVVLAIILIVLAFSSPQIDISELKYTQNIEQFKSNNIKGRMQLLLGCWIMTKQYSVNKNDTNQLSLLKKCLKKISRKDSVVKITSLVGKNMTIPKSYEEIVSHQQIIREQITTNQQFDKMLLQFVQKYDKQLQSIGSAQSEELKKKFDDEIAKRQKYYFGFIPANKFSFTAVVIGAGMILVLICTCFKYNNNKKDEEGDRYKKKFDRGSSSKTPARKRK